MLLVCDECGAVDSDGCRHPLAVPQPEGIFLCSECNPRYVSKGSQKTVPGVWHGRFQKELFNPETDIVENRPTNISL